MRKVERESKSVRLEHREIEGVRRSGELAEALPSKAESEATVEIGAKKQG